MGQVHNEVEKYLPNHAKIPASLQGKGGGGKGRLRRNAVVHKKKSLWVFPEVPEGWDPRGETREFKIEEPELPSVEIDGFKICCHLDEATEPLLVTRGDTVVNVPDYEGKAGQCRLCLSTFEDIKKAAIHLKCHGILGGSQHIMILVDRALKAEYLSIPIDGVTTCMTEEGAILEEEAKRKKKLQEEAMLTAQANKSDAEFLLSVEEEL